MFVIINGFDEFEMLVRVIYYFWFKLMILVYVLDNNLGLRLY